MRAARICTIPFAMMFAVGASAANISWNGTTDALWSTGGNWTGGITPIATDVAVFDANSTANLSTMLGADVSLLGLKITTPGGLVTIGGSNVLTLGAGGIDMSGASQDLLLNALLTLAGNQSWNVASGRTLTANGVIVGTNVNLNKIGTGVLTLAGANTFTGTTTIGGGTLNVSGSLNGTAGTDLTFTGTGIFNVTEAAGVNQGMGVLRFNGGDGVVKSTNNGGSNTLRFSSRAQRAAGATGNFVLAGGTAGTPGNPGTPGTNNIAITGELSAQLLDRGLFYNGTKYAAYDAGGFVRGLIYGTDLNAPASIAAGVTLGVNGASLNVEIAGSISGQTTASVNTISDPGAFSITLAGGQTLSFNGFLKSGANAATITGGNGITTTAGGNEMVIRTDGAVDSLTISASILDNGGSSLTKSGAGTLTLSGVNSYSGGTTVNAGSIILSNRNGLGSGTVTLLGGTNFKTSGFEGNTAGGALPNAFVLSGGKVTTDVAFGGANDMWINTPVSGPGGFVVTGSGRDQGLTLSGAKTFSGGVTLGVTGSSGDTPNVNIDNNASLGTGILRSEVRSANVVDGALRLQASVSNVTNPIVIASGARIVIKTQGNSATLNGVISDEGSGGSFLTHGTGTVTLGVANTFKGTTTIATGGTVLLANPLALQKSTLSYDTGNLNFGTLTAATMGGLKGSLNLSLVNGSASAVALSVGNNNQDTIYTGVLGGAGDWIKIGTGVLSLSNSSALSQTGATNINGGTLLISSIAPDIPSSAVSVNSGGTLAITTNTLTLHNTLTFSGASGYQVQTGATLTGSTVINGNLDVTGTPVLKLASDNTTPVAGTKVIATYAGALLNSAAWTVNASLLNSSGSQLSNWTAGNGTWVTPANWDQQGWGGSVFYDTANKQLQLTGFAVGNIAPLPSTLATIAPGNNATVSAPAVATTVASLTIGNSGAFTHTLNLQPGAPLKVNGPVTVNASGTLNASAAPLTANTLNMNGGTVTLGSGSSAGIVNITAGTLAATGGNELTVSNKFIVGTTTISAGTTPFKIGGGNLVSNVEKLMLQGGTTSIASPNTISLADVGTQWSGTADTLVSNNFTVSPSANVLVVTVNQRTLSPTGSAYSAAVHPTVFYNGVPLTLNNAAGGAFGYGQINGFVNSQIFYMLNAPTGAASALTVNFPYAGTDYVINAFTLAGVSTSVPVQTNGYVQETTNTPSSVGISLSGVSAGSAVVSAYMQRFNNAVTTSTSSGTLLTSGTGGGSGDFWSYIGPNTAAAGALALGANAGTVTITHASTSAAREIFAAAAFAPASFPVSMPSAAVNVAASNTLDFGGAPSVTLGGLTLESGSALTLANAPGGVTFSSITANGTSQITAGSPMSLSGGGVNIPAGQTLTVANAIASGSITKQNSGTLLLSGVSTYTGATNINTGTLTLAGSGALGNTAVTVAGGAVFSVKPGAAIGTTGAGTNGATLTLNAGATLTMADGAIGIFNIQQNASFASDGLVASVAGGTAPALSFDLGNGTIDLINVTKGVTTTNAVRGQINFTTLPGLTSLTPGNYPFINAADGLGASAFTLNVPRIVVGTGAYDLTLANSTASQEILSISPYTGPAPIQTFTSVAAGAPINVRPGTGLTMSLGTLSNTGMNVLAVNLTSGGTLNVTGMNSSSSPVANGAPATISGTINTGTIAGTRSWQVTNTDNDAVNPSVSGGGTVNVYDFANAKYTGGAVAFGNVHKLGTATVSLPFGNQTVTSASFQDWLSVSATTSNPGVTATGFSGLPPSTNGSSTSNLIFSANTNALGSLAGSVTLNLTSVANGIAGLSDGAATVVGAPAPVTITGQVYSGLMIWSGSTGNWNTNANWDDSQSAAVHAPPGLDAVFTNVDTATFGSTSGAVTVNLGGVAPSLNAITFNNTGSYTIEGAGAIKLAGVTPAITSSGTHIISAPLTLANNLAAPVNGGTLTISGAIGQTGTAALVKSGAGTLELGGANTFTGATTITGGVLSINSIQNAGSATPNALGRPAVGANSIIALADTATLRFTGSSNGNSDRVINLSTAAGGTFTLDASGSVPFTLTSAITTSGTSGISTLTLTGNGNGLESGVIANGAGTNITALVKSGPGSWTLGATNTYTGGTTVNGGTLVLGGSLSGAAIVNNTGTLTGDGASVGNVTINSGGRLSPGVNGTGALNTGTLTFNTGGIFQFQIDSAAPALDFINIDGNLNIAIGAVMNVSDLGSVILAEGISAPIISYSGVWNGGGFLGLADDSIFTVGLNAYQISYNGVNGSTPEVTLTVVPEPGAAVSLLGGLGLLLGVRRRRS